MPSRVAGDRPWAGSPEAEGQEAKKQKLPPGLRAAMSVLQSTTRSGRSPRRARSCIQSTDL